MIAVGTQTLPLAEAWKRFSQGNADRNDYSVILADLLDVTLINVTPSPILYKQEGGLLADYPLYCALIASKQEVGRHIRSVLNYSDEQIVEVRKMAKAAAKASLAA